METVAAELSCVSTVPGAKVARTGPEGAVGADGGTGTGEAATGGVTNGLVGAWGPVVTPFLLHRGVPPRISIGCVNTAEVAEKDYPKTWKETLEGKWKGKVGMQSIDAGGSALTLFAFLREKVDPYLRPIYDALYDFMEARHVERALQTGMFEIAPLAFMRGRTLTNAVVLLDEAQNTTSMQMKMVLTRLGEESQMVVTGDPGQSDLPGGKPEGLLEALSILEGVEGVAVQRFTDADVVRHALVSRIVRAYTAKGR